MALETTVSSSPVSSNPSSPGGASDSFTRLLNDDQCVLIDEDGDVQLASQDGIITAEMQEEEHKLEKHHPADEDDPPADVPGDAFNSRPKFDQLSQLLDKTAAYSTFLSNRLKSAQQALSAPSAEEETKDTTKKGSKKRGRKAAAPQEDKSLTKRLKSMEEKTGSVVAAQTSGKVVRQPRSVTGGELRDYQLQGMEWLISLYENGLNGILADEMGLGKTLQTISFIAFLRERKVYGPFLVVGPLSTLPNWVHEFQTWTPEIPALLYHGTKEEREVMRRERIPPSKLKDNADLPVVITSYEVVMKDQKYLKGYPWKYIIVDEGHRLKNLNCKLIKQLKSYESANRLLLTGTPLQNNLSELWSLLNFLLPTIFDDLESFQSWFRFDSLESAEGEAGIIAQERSNQVVTKLHHIIRPFLLRRTKADVCIDIPKKKEIVLSAPMSSLQREYYKSILENDLSPILANVTDPSQFKKSRSVGLLNILMQLRKVCNHPYLFYEPTDEAGMALPEKELVHVSGKLGLLDRLLPRLKAGGHKILLFSQMTRMLDILEDYFALRKYQYCRLDGSTPMVERQDAIKRFQTDPNLFVFLLSTRAGGLGINLTGADTVIIYDSDFNPQMDLQAIDRCHRIGQKKAVVVYRLVTANSVEEKVLERANQKRKLEKLVISGGFLKNADKKEEKALNITELVDLLRSSDHDARISGEQLISDRDFDLLTDDRTRTGIQKGSGFHTVERSESEMHILG